MLFETPQIIKNAENWQYKRVSLLSKDFAFPSLSTCPEREDIVINMTTSSGTKNKENFEHMLFRLEKTTTFIPVNLYQILYITILIIYMYKINIY